MMKIWLFLLAFLTLGVGPEDADADQNADADQGGEDATIDDILNAASELGGEQDAETEDPPALKAEKERARRLEDDLARERETNAVLRRASQPAPAAGPSRDPQTEQEDRELEELRRSNAPASAIAAKEWQVNANRTLRQTTQSAQAALSEAREIADRTNFDGLISKQPVLKKYAAQVEQMIGEARGRGQAVPPRSTVLALVVGQAVLDGKAQAKSKPKAKEEANSVPAQNQVPRGRSPVVRGDAAARGRLSEREARRKRLEGQPI